MCIINFAEEGRLVPFGGLGNSKNDENVPRGLTWPT